MVDVNWGDLIQYLGRDTRTRAILIYMESIGDAGSFLSAAREVALVEADHRHQSRAHGAGRQSRGLAHRRPDRQRRRSGCGVPPRGRAPRRTHLRPVLHGRSAGQAAASQRQPADHRHERRRPSRAGHRRIDRLRRGTCRSRTRNDRGAERDSCRAPGATAIPIDILGDAGPDRYAKSLEIAAKDPNSDGLLVVLTPQAMTDPTKTAEALKPYAKLGDKPVLASWMGGPEVQAGTDILNRAEIPVFPYPDTAARAFQYMWRYTYNLRGLYETPTATESGNLNACRMAEDLITDGAGKRTHAAHRVRIEEPAGDLRHPDGGYAHRADRRTRPFEKAAAIGYPGGAEALLGNHHAQDRRRRSEAEPELRRTPSGTRSRPSRPRSKRRPAPSTSRASPCSPW